MNLVSPSTRPKPFISIPARFNMPDDKTLPEDFDEYKLFLFLEKQRIMKLRELYHGISFVVKKNDQSKDDALPKYPPRYLCLDLSAQSLVADMKKQRRDLSLQSSTKEQFRALDRTTKAFLGDTINVLRDQCTGNRSQSRCSTPQCPPSISPTPITPPSSPLPAPAPEDFLHRGRHQKATIEDVDISDSEIISLWNCTTPSVDGVDFDICLGTKKKECDD